MTAAPSTTVRDLIAKKLSALLDEHRVVVWYDGRQECGVVFDTLQRSRLVKVDARRSMLVARREADAAWASIVDPSTPPPRGPTVLIYVPWPRATAEREVEREPFEVYARIGAAFGADAAESLPSLARQALPAKAADIDKLYASNDAVTLSQIEALADRAGYPFLGKVFGTQDPVEIASCVLCDAERVRQGLAAAGVRDDLTRLLRDAFGFDAPVDLTELRGAFARWVLFSEFAFDLKGDPPAHTVGVARADGRHARAIYALCDRVRGADGWRDCYKEMALQVELELQLSNIADEPGDWGDRDTFLAEDRATLRWVQDQCIAGRLTEARRALDLRKTSIWARESERAHLWQLATRCLDLLESAERARQRMVPASRPVQEHIAAYVAPDDGLWRLDRCQRWMGRAEANCAERDVLEPLVEHATGVHRSTTEASQNAFLDAVLRDGWPPPGPKQSQVYSRHVAPALAEGARVAYFLVDALRFEMGRDLGEMLAKIGEVSIEPSSATLPATTTFGMAALLPGAEAGVGCELAGDELVPVVGGKPMPDVNARKRCFHTALGDRHRDLRLDDLLAANDAKLRQMIGKAPLLVVRSDDIDRAGEGTSAPTARRFISSILDDVTAVAQRLARAGVRRMVFAADHGHVLVNEIVAGDVLQGPPGKWPVAKRRSRVGFASGVADGVRVVKAAQLGMAGPLGAFAVAPG
jgi:hypothetical protein